MSGFPGISIFPATNRNITWCEREETLTTSLSLVSGFCADLSSALGAPGGGLHEPEFGGNEKKYLLECIDSGFVSSVGNFVTQFEEELAAFTGAPFAIATVSGTAALHLALIGAGVQPGDEVLVPAISFVATASAVIQAGAVPHFVDVSSDSWGLDPEALGAYLATISTSRRGKLTNTASGRSITAVIPMHTLGHPVDMPALRETAGAYGLQIVEDAAESLGSYVGKEHTGLAGTVGVLSFNGNKTITTGGGGALLTSDAEIARKIRHLSTTARIPHPWEFDHDEIGYNYRMPNINAALGLAQLEQLAGFLIAQRALHRRYQGLLAGSKLGEVKSERPETTSNYWLQSFLLAPQHQHIKDDLIQACISIGLPVRPLWKPLNTLKPYSHFPSAPTSVSNDLYSRVVCLPSSVSLAAEKVPV